MKRIAFFCIPAYGHTNPMLPVAGELVRRGDQVRFYSFQEYRDKIEATGAVFVSCDAFLPGLNEKQAAGIMRVSTTEMTIQDIRITLNMNQFLEQEISSFSPDVIYTDSVCFWGKLNAWKYRIPMVVSTSTFAFNQLSSQYMKNSPGEMMDMIFGLPKISREMKKLEPYGYHVSSALALVQNDNNTDTVVYTSRKYQPYSASFSDHYAFVGPSVFSESKPNKSSHRPLIYISMGTVLNDRPDFYAKCIEGLKDMEADVIISCGKYVNPDTLGSLPDNIRAYPSVDQLEVLSRANLFLTHCGMNSVSESLYMAAPMVLYPQTGEEYAVAQRAAETGAGIFLKDDSARGIRNAVQEVLQNPSYAKAAADCSVDFRSCSGPAGAATFIEGAPHTAAENNILRDFNRKNGEFQILYWLIVSAALTLLGILTGWEHIWIIGIAAGILNAPLSRSVQKRVLRKLMASNEP